MQGAAERAQLGLTSALPETIEAREVTTPDGSFGYIRIWTFFQDLGPNVDFVEAFIQEFIRLVEQLPSTGLIIDVRGNGGEIVWAGERLLQLLTPRRVVPEPAQFINSALNLQLCDATIFSKTGSTPSSRPFVRVRRFPAPFQSRPWISQMTSDRLPRPRGFDHRRTLL